MPGFRSRWTTPCACAYASASTAESSSLTTSRERPPLQPALARSANSSASDRPSSHSSTVYGTSALVAGAIVVPLAMLRDDVQVALRQLVVKAALVTEAPDERLDEGRPERRRELQALDGDGLAQSRRACPR